MLWNGVDCLIGISKRFKNVLVAVSVLFISFNLICATAGARDSLHSTAQSRTLPNAPQPAQTGNESSQSGNADSLRNSTGNISGSVVDARGDVLQGAQITLLGPSRSDIHTAVSNSDGQFAFTGLQPGVYRITVTGSGMSIFTSAQISLQAGQDRTLPPATLLVFGGATSVTVNGNEEELSKEQVQIAVQQRIGKVIPNFYSSYDWNAPPMLAKEKFHLSARSLIDPITFITVAGVAGVEQNRNIFPAYGSGIEGYGKRYGAALANHATSNLLAKALYPSIFHQDPRYFYKGTGSGPSRAFYAVSCAFVTRGDAGNRMPNYSHILGGFTAAAISNLYYPEADRGASLVLVNGLVDIGADAAANLIREFVLKGITSHAPKSNNP